MIYRTETLARMLDKKRRTENEKKDPFMLVPCPDIQELEKAGSASIDLRLGTWFATFRRGQSSIMDVNRGAGNVGTESILKMHYVAFGDMFILHPRAFVLGATLEWLRIPRSMAGYVTSRSSWGRRGLVIATATGVHPGFSGCLTLELTNVGETPIALRPGIAVSQIFMHHAPAADDETMDRSTLMGKRKPVLGDIIMDKFTKCLIDYGSGSSQYEAKSGGSVFMDPNVSTS